MTTSTVHFVSGIALVLSLFATPTFAATTVNGGVIHFQGAVVADPCEISPRHQQLAISCPENNRMRTQTVNYTEILNGQRAFQDMAMVSMKYINPQKTLAIVQVDYR